MMAIEYEARLIGVVVVPEGKPLYADTVTRIEIDDETGGEFVKVTQNRGSVGIDPDEWPAVREAIDRAIRDCRVGPADPKDAVRQRP